MTVENGPVTSGAILREVRALVLALVKSPPAYEDSGAWEAQLRALGQLEMIYGRPVIVPTEKPPILQRIE